MAPETRKQAIARERQATAATSYPQQLGPEDLLSNFYAYLDPLDAVRMRAVSRGINAASLAVEPALVGAANAAIAAARRMGDAARREALEAQLSNVLLAALRRHLRRYRRRSSTAPPWLWDAPVVSPEAKARAFVQEVARGRTEFMPWMLRHGVQLRDADDDVHEATLFDKANCLSIRKVGEHAMFTAAGLGRLGVVDWLAQRDVPLSAALSGAAAYVDPVTTMNEPSSILWVAYGGRPVLEWLQENGVQMNSMFMFGSAQHGRVEAIEWLAESCGVQVEPLCIEAAATMGHVDVMEWLQERYGVMPAAQVMETAAEGGHLAVMEWLERRGGLVPNARAMVAAVTRGHMEVVEWLEKRGLQRPAAAQGGDAG
ncbi:hypothetical protein HYH03_011063 [Edaphochlamys debaryana]|uniref:Uncharacterized protein n=1 Tax=Edaphochlamys debaryana TaxID=47281 RepID=A0A835XSK3_9CHLO|nr:hypothetical protein HYH03_011063 [Edaphochlamys debaryana]|eukprot:KAG2490427.1 hypothetical protein HYH03_011063 [Edaphochlamys debaryana]